MDRVVDDADVLPEDENDHDVAVAGGTRSLCKWTKGVADPTTDSRVNIWSKNGYGQPVFTGGMYMPDEIRTLDRTVKDYCASKSVTMTQLCGGQDHSKHNKEVRGAWQEISMCLPHRTVLSVYRRALRQFHGMTRGVWSAEEVASLFNLVGLHGHRWKTIQDKLGRSAIDCRVKFLALNDKFHHGKWSVEEVDLFLRKVRSALELPKDGMDVREINQWTLDNETKIPWTAVSFRVNRKRQDCYYKWKQMTKRSNKKAKDLGLEPIPMARETLKFDAKVEYHQWKAEQDPKYREEYAKECVMPLLTNDGDCTDDTKERDLQLLDSIIGSKASRSSEVSWHSLVHKVEDPKERWEYLVDNHANDDDLDLPLWKLALVVKEKFSRTIDGRVNHLATMRKTFSKTLQDSRSELNRENNGVELKKKRKLKTNSGELVEDLISRIDAGPAKAGATTGKVHNNTEDGDDEKAKPKKKRKRKKASDKLSISGVTIQQLQRAIIEIVGSPDSDSLTSKQVRKQMEKQFDIDLSSNKEVVKKMIKEAL